ncbi:type II toxin-antitoxin system VapC family toxin [Candidatus Woesearchaeota archaeon]|nr:type II toxin-antitoxin system VapC family toxin [Candidatus Woesearchaeota archaeon]
MERQKKVVDASIGVKWFSPEEDTPKSRELLKNHIEKKIKIIVPDLFFYEVLNALRFNKNSEKYLKKVALDLESFELEIINVSLPLLEKSVENSVKYNLTIYDAVYLTIAKEFNNKLISADKKILSSNKNLVEGL